MTLAALAERINRTSTAHGFWPTDREEALEALTRIDLNLNAGGEPNEDMALIRRYVEAQAVRNMGEMLMLAVSELAEALEEDRDGQPIAEWRCKKCKRATGSIDPASLEGVRHPESGHHSTPGGMNCWGEFKPEGILVELMDCVIRCLDTALGVVRTAGEDPSFIDYTTQTKMNYNDSRPFKHGRAY